MLDSGTVTIGGAAVPEPASFLLLGLSAGPFVFRRLRRALRAS